MKNKDNLSVLREKLLKKKKDAWNSLKKEYFDTLGKEYAEQFSTPADIEDLSVIDLIEDTGLKIAENRKNELVAIEEALRKIDEGSYGRCDLCDGDIGEARLNVMPHAILCISCQKKSEG